MISKRLHFLTIGIFILTFANALNDFTGRPFYTITKMIYFGWEGNIATWYSSFIFAVGALLAYQCYLKAKSVGVINYSAFLLFALLLITMSCDEVAQFHETFGLALGKYIFGVDVTEGVGIAISSAWVWGGGLVIISIFAICFIYVLRPILLVSKAARLLPAGLLLIIFGGIVLEASTNFLKGEGMQWIFDIEVIVEETLEMLGAMFIVYALSVWLEKISEQESVTESAV